MEEVTIKPGETGFEKPTNENKQEKQPTNQPSENPQETRPSWLPDKFKSPEDLSKAYQELERKLGENQPNKKEDPNKASEDSDKQKQQEEDPTKNKETFNPLEPTRVAKYQEEYLKNKGSLSEESYQELEKHGYSRDMVNDHIKAKADQEDYITAKFYEKIGGKDGYMEVVQWAAQNLSQEEIKAYDSVVTRQGVTVDEMTLAVEGLYAKYERATGNKVGTPISKLVKGKSPSSSGEDAYESNEQITEDMKNPLYKKDPAFREKVQRKMKAAQARGII